MTAVRARFGFDPLPEDWVEYADCHPVRRPDGTDRAEWLNRWFPRKENGGRSRARDRTLRACRQCAVRFVCFEYSLDAAELPIGDGLRLTGLFAGLGSGQRERLLPLRRRSQHRFTDGCECSYCTAAAKALAGQVWNSNGDGASCGRLSTYRGGCRCQACRYASALQWHRRKVIAA